MSVWRALLLVVTLSGLRAAAVVPEKPKVVVLSVVSEDKALAALASSVTEQVLTELGQTRRIDVIGSSDLTAMLGLERQKQLLGCSDSANSCVAELSAAMGAPWVVMGAVARAGPATRIDLKLIRASDGRAIWRSGKVLKDDGELFDAVGELADELVAALAPPTLAQLGISEPVAGLTAPRASGASSRLGPWLLMGGGGALMVLGAVFAIVGWTDPAAKPGYNWQGAVSTSEVARREGTANGMIAFGISAASVGVAALASGLIWSAAGQPAQRRVVFVPGGTSLWLCGAF